MLKSKLKLNLIDDYIKINQIGNFYTYFNKNPQFSGYLVLTNNILRITSELKSKYEQIFFKLGLLDSSFEVLKKQILYSTGWLFAENSMTDADYACKLRQNLQNLKNIEQNLPKWLKKLDFSEFEIKYIVNAN